MNFFERLKDRLADIFYYPVLHFYQRRTRGFDDRDMLDLNYTMAKFILPRLKYHKEITCTWPGECHFKSNEEWHECLDKMIFAFEYIIESSETLKWCDVPCEEIVAVEKKMQEGLRLFGEHFTALWD